MNFNETFLSSLQTNATLSKAMFSKLFLPKSLYTPADIAQNLPYVQAYGCIQATYPYYYELSRLDSYCMIFTEKGAGKLTAENTCCILETNTAAFVDCMFRHTLEAKQSTWEYKVFFMKGGSIPFLFKTIMDKTGSLHTFSSCSDIPGLIRKFYLQLERNKDNYYLFSRYIGDILTDIIMEEKQSMVKDVKIPEYLMYIKHRFDEAYPDNFSLKQLEAEYHISKFRICRDFTEYFNDSPMKYLNRKRIEAAKEALRDTDRRINEIGRMVGFDNTNHFIRLFKQQTGVTPLLYRKQPPAI